MQPTIRYAVVKDGYIVGTYETRKRARAVADKADMIYGAYVYSVKAVVL